MTANYPPYSSNKLNINYIKQKLIENDHWLYRGILAIYKRQTENEKYKGITIEKNGRGFNAIDADVLSSYAIKLKKEQILSEYEKITARRLMVKYAKQLHEIALEKMKDKEK